MMSDKRLIIIASLLAFCVCSPEKKNCIRPTFFKDVGELADYVKCIKTITGSPPYGKRSIPQSSPFFQKPHSVLRDYDPDYLMKKLIFNFLKAEKEMQA